MIDRRVLGTRLQADEMRTGIEMITYSLGLLGAVESGVSDNAAPRAPLVLTASAVNFDSTFLWSPSRRRPAMDLAGGWRESCCAGMLLRLCAEPLTWAARLMLSAHRSTCYSGGGGGCCC